MTADPQEVAGGYPDHLRRLVDGYLADLGFSTVEATAGLEEAMRYSLLAGGKRIRPVLTLATAESLGLDPVDVLPTAAAIELIHTYSLIHDDLPAMDDDSLRRGKPTSHMVFGEDVAILAGDALFAEAINLICSRQQAAPDRLLRAVAELVGSAGIAGMVGGQYVDVTVENSGNQDLDDQAREVAAARLRELHSLKTGKLIAASVILPLWLQGVGDGQQRPYREFAEELGVLFQIVDDILDVAGDDAKLGKKKGSDERHGKLTYVSLFGLDDARKRAERSHRAARAALDAIDGSTDDLALITDFIYLRQS